MCTYNIRHNSFLTKWILFFGGKVLKNNDSWCTFTSTVGHNSRHTCKRFSGTRTAFRCLRIILYGYTLTTVVLHDDYFEGPTAESQCGGRRASSSPRAQQHNKRPRRLFPLSLSAALKPKSIKYLLRRTLHSRTRRKSDRHVFITVCIMYRRIIEHYNILIMSMH